MSTTSCATPNGETGIRSSRLADSLMKLHENLDTLHQNEQHRQSLFEQWQRQWRQRGERITRQLAIIDAQLASLDEDDDQRTGQPHLSLFEEEDRNS